MEHKLHVAEPEEFMKDLPALLNEAESIPLLISGNSMLPFLVHGRDTVYLSKITEPLKKGDIILYKRLNGAYILHRICKKEGQSLSLIGDAQPIIEKGIKEEQAIAIVKKVKRKGKLIGENSFIWFFFKKIWLNIIPARGFIIRLYSKFK